MVCPVPAIYRTKRNRMPRNVCEGSFHSEIHCMHLCRRRHDDGG